MTGDLSNHIQKLLSDIQYDMYKKASNEMFSSISRPKTIHDFQLALENKYMCLIPFCLNKE